MNGRMEQENPMQNQYLAWYKNIAVNENYTFYTRYSISCGVCTIVTASHPALFASLIPKHFLPLN